MQDRMEATEFDVNQGTVNIPEFSDFPVDLHPIWNKTCRGLYVWNHDYHEVEPGDYILLHGNGLLEIMGEIQFEERYEIQRPKP